MQVIRPKKADPNKRKQLSKAMSLYPIKEQPRMDKVTVRWPVGTMVRVKDDALREDGCSPFWRENVGICQKEGYIYFVGETPEDEDEDWDSRDGHHYYCRSLATGEDMLRFFEIELEAITEVSDAKT